MQASTWICTYQMQPIKVHELALPTCVLLLSKNFDPSPFFNVAPSLSMSNFQLLLLPHEAFTYLLHIFVPTSPPLSSIFIKGVHLIDTKDCIGVDGWHLNLAFFMDTTTYIGMTPLVALEIPHVGSFWPWYQSVGHLPLCHSMGHPLDKLELLLVRELSSLNDHLKLRITCGNTIWQADTTCMTSSSCSNVMI